jgi:hypothetical protein
MVPVPLVDKDSVVPATTSLLNVIAPFAAAVRIAADVPAVKVAPAFEVKPPPDETAIEDADAIGAVAVMVPACAVVELKDPTMLPLLENVTAVLDGIFTFNETAPPPPEPPVVSMPPRVIAAPELEPAMKVRFPLLPVPLPPVVAVTAVGNEIEPVLAPPKAIICSVPPLPFVAVLLVFSEVIAGAVDKSIFPPAAIPPVT